MMRAARALLMTFLLSVPLLPSQTDAATFWNPFRNVPSGILTELRSLLESVTDTIHVLTERAVGGERIADPQWIGEKPQAAYLPSFLGLKTRHGPRPVPPSPRPDGAREGTPCGGGAGDPYWANDCSCRCSRGGTPGLTYDVSDQCPDDPNLACEGCRQITRHDRLVTTIAECRAQAGSDPGGGVLQNDHFGL